MRIANYLRPDCVALRQRADSLQGAVQQLVALLDGAKVLTDTAVFAADVRARLELGGVCVGNGLAIPHAKSTAVEKLQLAALTLDPPLPCDTPDSQPLEMLFLIAAPAEANDLHVQVLAELATLFLDTDFCASLRQSETPEAFCRAIARREAQDDPAAPPPTPTNEPGYRLLGVTACPTGIAHTYLAAEALQQAAQTRGLTIKVETNGAGGVGNELTEDEIQAADCIIVAVDRSISLARFVGKRLVYTSAGEAVRNADALLEKAVSGKASIYRGGHAFRTNDWKELGREYYGHLMSGISHMLPFVVAGGVMLALSLLLQHLGGPANWSTMMTNVGNAALAMMYPILSAFIAYSIADRPGLMPGLMGGYLAQTGMTTATKLSWIPSGFWGGLIAGFAAGLVVRLLNRLFRRIPQDLDHIKTGLLVPLLSLLFVGWLMLMVVNPPLGRFNRWMSLALAKLQGGSRLVLGAVLGALMATDYGGPINKAAYVTGTLAMTNSQYDLMAAVMAGGMIPPAGAGTGLPAVPDAVHQGRAPHRAAEPCDGRVLCDRGCAALCPARPAAGRTLLHGRQCAGRVPDRTVWLRLPCAPRRIVPACRHRQSAGLFGCPGGWQSADHIVGRYAEEACEVVNFRFLRSCRRISAFHPRCALRAAGVYAIL